MPVITALKDWSYSRITIYRQMWAPMRTMAPKRGILSKRKSNFYGEYLLSLTRYHKQKNNKRKIRQEAIKTKVLSKEYH